MSSSKSLALLLALLALLLFVLVLQKWPPAVSTPEAIFQQQNGVPLLACCYSVENSHYHIDFYTCGLCLIGGQPYSTFHSWCQQSVCCNLWRGSSHRGFLKVKNIFIPFPQSYIAAAFALKNWISLGCAVCSATTVFCGVGSQLVSSLGYLDESSGGLICRHM